MKNMLLRHHRTRAFSLLCVGASLCALGCDRSSDSPNETASTGTASTDQESAGEIAAVDDEAAQSPLRIEPTELVMGDLLPNTPVEKTVRLTNTGSSPIKILKALADCGCTTPTWPEEPIAPGESVETTITMDAGTQQGVELVKRVTFDLEGMDPVFLTVKGRVATYLTFGPSTLEGPMDGTTELPSGEVKIESADGQEFAVVAVEPDVSAPLPSQRALTQKVMIDWERWRAAGKPVRIVIETDHPIAPKLGIIVRRSLRGNPSVGSPTNSSSANSPATSPATSPAISPTTSETTFQTTSQAS